MDRRAFLGALLTAIVFTAIRWGPAALEAERIEDAQRETEPRSRLVISDDDFQHHRAREEAMEALVSEMVKRRAEERERKKRERLARWPHSIKGSHQLTNATTVLQRQDDGSFDAAAWIDAGSLYLSRSSIDGDAFRDRFSAASIDDGLTRLTTSIVRGDSGDLHLRLTLGADADEAVSADVPIELVRGDPSTATPERPATLMTTGKLDERLTALIATHHRSVLHRALREAVREQGETREVTIGEDILEIEEFPKDLLLRHTGDTLEMTARGITRVSFRLGARPSP